MALSLVTTLLSDPTGGGALPAVIKSLGHHTVFLLLLQIAALLGIARLLGEIMRKLKQPAGDRRADGGGRARPLRARRARPRGPGVDLPAGSAPVGLDRRDRLGRRPVPLDPAPASRPTSA
jgi:hypothetical protein